MSGTVRKALLFHPRTEHNDNYRNYWIPYSILSLAAVVHQRIGIRLLDQNVEDSPGDSDLIAEVERAGIVGISTMTGRQIGNGLRFARLVREIRPRIPIIWGGAHPTLFAEQMLGSPLVDAVVIGPGELPFEEIIRRQGDAQTFPRIPGVAWIGKFGLFNGGQAQAYPTQHFPAFPWDLLPLERYVRTDENIASRTLNYVSSQGCPFPCGFCSEIALHKSGWNAFPPERVVDDIRALVRRVQINGLKFYDANFFVSVPRALQLAALMTPLGLRWAASCHPATLLRLTEDQLATLTRSGLCRLLIGLESGVQKVLDLIRKQIAVKDMAQIAERLAAHNVVGSFTFVVGFPGISDDLEQTLRLGERLREIWPRHEVKVHIYAPYPGTPMWADAIKSGFVPPSDLDGWSAFDYYAVMTPWVKQEWQKLVREFNQEHCPYVDA